MNDRAREIFFDVHADLPRQGPGGDDSTRRALDLCAGLSSKPRILDIGCGPGAQTLTIADALPGATITAIDTHEPFLREARARAVAAGYEGRIVAQHGDMSALTFAPESFDLIWAEGSAYIMGVAAALSAWKPLLKPGGFIGLTELVWLTDSPPVEAADFFGQEYPAMTTTAANLAIVDTGGYRLLGHFTVPGEAWWDGYYTPLAAKIPDLEKKYAGDEIAHSVLEASRRELDIRRRFGDSYGYEFFVMRKPS